MTRPSETVIDLDETLEAYETPLTPSSLQDMSPVIEVESDTTPPMTPFDDGPTDDDESVVKSQDMEQEQVPTEEAVPFHEWPRVPVESPAPAVPVKRPKVPFVRPQSSAKRFLAEDELTSDEIRQKRDTVRQLLFQDPAARYDQRPLVNTILQLENYLITRPANEVVRVITYPRIGKPKVVWVQTRLLKTVSDDLNFLFRYLYVL